MFGQLLAPHLTWCAREQCSQMFHSQLWQGRLVSNLKSVENSNHARISIVLQWLEQNRNHGKWHLIYSKQIYCCFENCTSIYNVFYWIHKYKHEKWNLLLCIQLTANISKTHPVRSTLILKVFMKMKLLPEVLQLQATASVNLKSVLNLIKQ